MNILMAGGSGFLGQELGVFLTREGHSITLIDRHPEAVAGKLAYPTQKILSWNQLDQLDTSDVEAVINLSGASVADTPWTAAGKALLRESRVNSTRQLVSALAQRSIQPKVWVQASAVGFYGDRGSDPLTESSPQGQGFLAELCRDWESSTTELNASTRICHLRFAPILGLSGGALATLDSMYANGLGASLGRHCFPWIHVIDACRIVVAALNDSRLSGAINAAAPQSLTYQDFHRALCRQKQVYSLPSPPRWVLQLALGEKSTFLLNSQCVIPQKLIDHHFKFQFSDLASAFADLYQSQKRSGVFWLERKQWIPRPQNQLWDFFCDEHNLEQITPDILQFRVLGKSTATMGQGTIINYRLKIHGIPKRWTSLIDVWDPPHAFVDTQLKGPYKFWYHQHLFEPLGTGTLAIDRVQYQLPLGAIGTYIATAFVRRDVTNIFKFRSEVIKKLFYSDERNAMSKSK